MANGSSKIIRPVSRRTLLRAAAVGIAAPQFFVRNGWAAGKNLYVGTYTNIQGEVIRKQVIPKFQADYDCKVFQTENVTLGSIALLRTQKAAPNYSVIMMDDLGIPIAKAENLIEKLPRSKIPNLEKTFPRFIYNDDYGVAFAISTISPWFSSTLSKPIESWADLWDERFRGRFMLSTPKQSQSVQLLAMAASFATGKPILEAQYEIDKGWAKMAELKPNVQTIYESTGPAVLQVTQGQADVGGPDFSKSVVPYIVKGAPILQSKPKEGLFAGVNCMALVKGAPEPDLGAAFIDRMLGAEAQLALANVTYAAPSVKDLELKKDVAALVAYPESRVNELILLDWEKLNPQRGGIIEKYNQVFGG
ncbi:MAG TPA: extracellular solute-binding protein [Bradyrhizobium sp.]|nr:extracellular solute-binding protein [Bradyrhizobium sp.]